MVGVPGRSRACQTCKKRRIACDLREPACGQCTSTKRICPGYSRGLIFVQNQKGSHKTKYEKELNLDLTVDSGRKSSPPRSSSSSADSKAWTSQTSSNEEFNSSTLLLTKRQLSPQLPSQVSAAACVQEQLFSTALFTWDGKSSDARNYSPSWMPVLSMLGHCPPVTKAPALACYIAWAGRQNKDRIMVQSSMQLYLQGLNEVQRALNHTSTALDDHVLAGLLSLILYEALECPERTRTAYGWHVDGCMRLVKLRGVVAHRHGLGHALFLAFRTHGILRALELRQPSFLAEAAWSTIPWQIHPKSTYDRLLDILVAGPAIFAKADRMNEGPPNEILGNALALLEQCYMLHLKLESVHTEIQASPFASLCWEIPVSRVSSSDDPDVDDENLFESVFAFQTIEIARDLAFYWSIAALLWSGVADLFSALESAGCGALLENGSAPGGIAFLAVQYRWHEMTRNVLRSFDFCMSPEQIESGPFRISAPLNISIGVLQGRKQCVKEYNWALRARTKLADWLTLLKGIP
ncbi:Hypothetical protein R9X50_00424200 [Acrodontium crateriforme]|uniref:Zn(2)-C6 fungal-type domain-containing protein n=1 Tax=Acrodontium crateriforme TaxID=150365 RepID=A0AAQ3MAP1_9PEZI|nr:Hypothetical protein R9X50_00424200 [Acrodontium crateriforme]